MRNAPEPSPSYASALARPPLAPLVPSTAAPGARSHRPGPTATTPLNQVRVGIVAESRLAREGLRQILSADPAVIVVGDTELSAINEFLRKASPQILLVDARMPGALALCRDLRRNHVCPRVIIQGAGADEDWAVEALEAGARGILSNTATAEDLMKAVYVVSEGQIWARKDVVARVVDRLAALSVEAHLGQMGQGNRLSPREQEIIRLVGGGLSNKEIADRLAIAEATVKAHFTHIFQKLGVRDRCQLVALYYRTRTSAVADPAPSLTG